MKDYYKNSFFRKQDKNGNYHYFIYVKKQLIEVDEDVYKVCRRSYNNERNRMIREEENPVDLYDDMDKYQEMMYENNNLNVESNQTSLIFILIMECIDTLPYKYKDIAILSFIYEMTEVEIARQLLLPKTTVHNRKVKVQKILQEILIKNGVKP